MPTPSSTASTLEAGAINLFSEKALPKTKYLLSNGNEGWSFNTSSSFHTVVLQDTIAFLRRKAIGFTLNICCGNDPTGDVKADLDLAVLLRHKKQRIDDGDYVLCDVHHLPFKAASFDTVICDPPYSFYNRFKWIVHLSDLVKHNLLLSHNGVYVRLPLFNSELFFIRTLGLSCRLWWVFTRTPNLNQQLEVLA